MPPPFVEPFVLPKLDLPDVPEKFIKALRNGRRRPKVGYLKGPSASPRGPYC